MIVLLSETSGGFVSRTIPRGEALWCEKNQKSQCGEFSWRRLAGWLADGWVLHPLPRAPERSPLIACEAVDRARAPAIEDRHASGLWAWGGAKKRRSDGHVPKLPVLVLVALFLLAGPGATQGNEGRRSRGPTDRVAKSGAPDLRMPTIALCGGRNCHQPG